MRHNFMCHSHYRQDGARDYVKSTCRKILFRNIMLLEILISERDDNMSLGGIILKNLRKIVISNNANDEVFAEHKELNCFDYKKRRYVLCGP